MVTRLRSTLSFGVISKIVTAEHGVTGEQLAQWHEQGYCIIENFVPADVVADTVAQMHEIVPTYEQFVSEPDQWPEALPLTWSDFPYRSDLMNDLVLNPAMIDFARRALGTDDIVLAHSESITKYASEHDFDQLTLLAQCFLQLAVRRDMIKSFYFFQSL